MQGFYMEGFQGTYRTSHLASLRAQETSNRWRANLSSGGNSLLRLVVVFSLHVVPRFARMTAFGAVESFVRVSFRGVGWKAENRRARILGWRMPATWWFIRARDAICARW